MRIDPAGPLSGAGRVEPTDGRPDRHGRHDQGAGARPDPRVVVTGSSPRLLARPLAGFGSLVRVESPAEVRACLSDLGRRLLGVG